MPTYETDERFEHEFARLTGAERAAFARALRRFIAALRRWEREGLQGNPAFPAALRVKPFQATGSAWELTWAGDGRCLWTYGAPELEGHCHVIWLRIGSHEIYRDAG